MNSCDMLHALHTRTDEIRELNHEVYWHGDVGPRGPCDTEQHRAVLVRSEPQVRCHTKSALLLPSPLIHRAQ